MSSLLSPAPSPGLPTPARDDRRGSGSRAPLVRDTLRAHRVGAGAWIVAGGLTMIGMGAAVATEMADFPGGPQALAASVAAGAEALRLLRWPAERLDTLGGYVTYHNVILFNVFLAIYGVIQGARDIRGGEERGSLEEVLATGHGRSAVVRDRAVGFTLLAAVIGLGLGLGVAGRAGLRRRVGPRRLTDHDGDQCAARRGRLRPRDVPVAGRGQRAGRLGDRRSRDVRAVPGHQRGRQPRSRRSRSCDSSRRSTTPTPRGRWSRATASIRRRPRRWSGWPASCSRCRRGRSSVGTTPRRCGGLGRRPIAPITQRPGPSTVPRRMLGSVAAATVRRGWVGMAVWAGCTAAFVWMFAALQPAVMDMWDELDFIDAMTGAIGTTSAEDAYWSYIGELVTPVIAAYVITQASGWVADLAAGPGGDDPERSGHLDDAGPRPPGRHDGRGGSDPRGERSAGLAIGAVAVGGSVDPVGVGRMVAAGLLFGVALAAVAAIAVAVVRRPVAVTVLAVVVGASYLRRLPGPGVRLAGLAQPHVGVLGVRPPLPAPAPREWAGSADRPGRRRQRRCGRPRRADAQGGLTRTSEEARWRRLTSARCVGRPPRQASAGTLASAR